MKRHYLYILTSLLLLAFFLSCGTGANRESGDTSLISITVGGNGDKVKLKIEKNTPLKQAKIFLNKSLKPDTAIAAIPSNIYKIDFMITASDMTTITKEVLITGQDSITETFTIPNGKDRYFLVEAKDSSGYVIYEGSTTANLDGTDKELNISMTSVDRTPPTVKSVSPANGATDVSVSTTITATFSEAMDTSTITTSTFTVSGVSGTVTYSGTTATFTPSNNLLYSTTYTATINTGVKDDKGNAIESSYTWSFTTGSAPDTTAPTVSSVSPANGATDVSISTTITATFSEAMDTSTITTSTFTVSGVSGTVTYSGTTATFTPSTNLSYSTTYTATITTGVKDSAGNAISSNYSWTFTTGSAPDTTAPTVSSTSPASGSTGVSISPTITATFSEAMDTSTVTTSTFTLSNGGSVSGIVSYSGTTATWTPSSNLSYSTTYTAIITTGVKDSAGNAMVINYSWTFTTGSAPSTSTYLFYKGSINAVDPANPTNPIIVDSGTTTGEKHIHHHGIYNAATKTLSDGHIRTVIYASGGKLWKVSALKESGIPTPIQISNESVATSICNTWIGVDYANHNNSQYVYELPGSDISCSTTTDNIFKMIKVGMIDSDSPVPAKRPFVPLMDMTNGQLIGWLVKEGNNLNSYDTNFGNGTPIMTFTTDVSELTSTANNLIYLKIDNTLRAYNINTSSLSSSLHTFASTSIYSYVSDGSYLYFVDGNSIYRLSLDGSSSSSLLVTESAGTIDSSSFGITNNKVVYILSSSGTYYLKTIPKAGGSPTTLITTGNTIYLNGKRFITWIYYVRYSSSYIPSAGVINEDGTGNTETPSSIWVGWSYPTSHSVDSDLIPARIIRGDGYTDSSTGFVNGILISFDTTNNTEIANLGNIPSDIKYLYFSGTGENTLLVAYTSPSWYTDIFFANTGTANSLQRVTNTSTVSESLIY